ncbi:FAD-dependent oxidoreductase [Acinetobacter bereziniae]|nr:FAD-dependent oxidoreductase [Acinetobacter bereziniae]
MKENTKTAVVIGGGIVGICCALFLQKKGLNVTVIDPS